MITLASHSTLNVIKIIKVSHLQVSFNDYKIRHLKYLCLILLIISMLALTFYVKGQISNKNLNKDLKFMVL